ncbi:expressed unknown protein [Seminavis robusta]|uniref:Uncharacterized protein n=1 Tax=Seminavis robusta TaxID=568900 RepID=A0A9N8HY95_9STRA|nr:expressed unknown protein [Seminavis robusta]|eukprot:Sro2795_g337310.1 n/a (477) ;mRNA; r:7494-9085
MPPLYNMIANLRKNAEYIKFLTLSANHVGLDFSALVDAIHSNGTLQKVYLHWKFLACLTVDQMELLMEACASLPQLEELSVSLPPNRTHLSSLVVDKCVSRCPHLGKLVLRGFDRRACIALATCLGHHPSLVDVQLLDGSSDDCVDGESTTSGVSAVAKALADQHNSTVLKHLVLSCAKLHDSDIVALADALTSNTILESLDLRSFKDDDASEEKTKTTYAPLLRVFQEKQNETLQVLQTDAPEQLQAALHMYTQLNASGASQLLRKFESATNQDWVDVIMTGILIQNKQEEPKKHDEDTLSVLFHTLSQDPSFLLSYYSRPHDQEEAYKSPAQETPLETEELPSDETPSSTNPSPSECESEEPSDETPSTNDPSAIPSTPPSECECESEVPSDETASTNDPSTTPSDCESEVLSSDGAPSETPPTPETTSTVWRWNCVEVQNKEEIGKGTTAASGAMEFNWVEHFEGGIREGTLL